MRLPLMALCLAASVAHAGEVGDIGARIAKRCPALAAWADAQEAKHPTSVKDAIEPSRPALRDELARRAEADQDARFAIKQAKVQSGPLVDQAMKVDRENLAWLRPLVDRDGFPTVAEVGSDGVNHTWILVQHADADRPFQNRVLDQIRPRVATGEVDGEEFAQLTDRVLLAEGKKQRYGSQFVGAGDKPMTLRPVEDAAHLDDRRAAMGLPPMAAYRCLMDAMYSKG
jgi:hypothetical protein